MQITTGIDIIEIERIKNSIEETDGKFCEKVYTEKEIEYQHCVVGGNNG